MGAFLHLGSYRVPLLLSALFLVLLPASATLIVTVVNGGRMYVATDSFCLGTGTMTNSLTEKVFKFNNSCLVGISGCYGGLWDDTKAGLTYQVDLVKGARQLGMSVRTGTEALETNIAKAVLVFGEAHSNFVALRRTSSTNGQKDFHTVLGFSGFDEASHPVMRNYEFNERTPPTLQETQYPIKTVKFQGERQFPSALLSAVTETNFPATVLSNLTPDARRGAPALRDFLAGLASQDFKTIANRVYAGAPVKEEQIVRFLLEIFQLHKENAARLHFDGGYVDGPYVVFRIADGRIIQIASLEGKTRK
jgi:hypothetical protein